MPKTIDGLTHAEVATQYARDVVSDKIPAGRLVKLAALRHLNDLEASKSEDYLYEYDHAKGSRPCKFIELLPHVAGKWANRKELIKLEPWQCFIICSLFGWVKKADGYRRFKRAYCCIPRKNAKALALDTPIPTPTGWTTMGEVSVGDYVLGTDGRPRKVIAATEVMTGNTCYRVGFSNGDSIVADAGHLWLTDTRRDRDRDRKKGRGGWNSGPKPSIKTTEEIATTLLCRTENNHRVDVPNALHLPDVDLPVPPYVLGAWLGDGHSAGARITIGEQDCEETCANILAEGQPIRKASGKYLYNLSDGDRTQAARNKCLASILREMRVLNNKHIPAQYLRASFSQRLALLQGLMDTDGTCSKAGQCSLTTMSERLHLEFMELVRSLGIKPTVDVQMAKIYGKECGLAYRVHFFAYQDLQVFKLKRKIARQKVVPAKTTRARTIQITSCSIVPSVPVRCIQVDHPDGMYIAGRTFIPTHNSTLAAGLALYCLVMDNEYGAQVYSGATSRDQAAFVFSPAKEMAAKTEALAKRFGVEVNADSITVLKTNSRFTRLIGNPPDGSSPSFCACDEYHEHLDSRLHDTMTSGMGARDQPLMFVITTAGFDTSGPCYLLQKDMEKVLEGTLDSPTRFAIIYTCDTEPYTWNGVEHQADDWTTEAALIKANPNWGISVNSEDAIAEQQEAVIATEKQNLFKTKKLNIWCFARNGFFNVEKWNKCTDKTLTLADFADKPCVKGLDLASQIDLAADVSVFQKMIEDPATKISNMHYYIFSKFYIPEATVAMPTNQHYQKWVHDKHLIATPGDEIDFATIRNGILADVAEYDVREFCFDPHQSTLLKQEVVDTTGVESVPIPQNAPTLNIPMKWLQAMINAGRVHHDGNPVMTWCISNVVSREDANENDFPRKERVENKIDGVSALLCALTRIRAALGETDSNHYVYNGF